MATNNGEAVTGLVLTGEFLGTEQKPDKGEYPGKFVLSLLAGKRVYDVEFKDESVAWDLCPALGSAARGDALSVPVGVRSAKGYTFFFGRRGE